jgi:hypothetical protein
VPGTQAIKKDSGFNGIHCSDNSFEVLIIKRSITMRLVLLTLFITLPYFSYSQGFTIIIDSLEVATDKVPDSLNLPQRVDKFRIKKDKKENTSNPFIVQVGEEEHRFIPNGAYQQINFSHDIKGLVVNILDDKRASRGKAFKLKPKKIRKK